MNVDDICVLLSAISDLPPSNCATYQTQVRRQNINGQVLSVCDLTKLRSELQMNFGDWQLFNTLIMHLRSVEGSLCDHSRNSQAASFTGDVKSPHGSLAVSAGYPYSQVVLSHSPFVLCNEQSQARGKSMFDVPVLVQHMTLDSTVGNNRQNTDVTISDFSFGSGTDELEVAWRRDIRPDSLNDKEMITSRQSSSHSNTIWMQPSDRISKSIHDLRSVQTCRRTQPRHTTTTTTAASSRSGVRRSARISEKQVTSPVYKSTSSAPDHLVQMIPAYISRTPDSTSGIIPVWYPTLPCVGETNTASISTQHQQQQQQQSTNQGAEYSPGSSSVSMDGTYDFPSEYSSGDRHSQQRRTYRRQCPPNCPHRHREHRRRRKSSRSSRRSSSRRSSVGKYSQKSAEGCTCDYFLYEEDQSVRSSSGVNPWKVNSPRKISSPDLSDIEALTSS